MQNTLLLFIFIEGKGIKDKRIFVCKLRKRKRKEEKSVFDEECKLDVCL